MRHEASEHRPPQSPRDRGPPPSSRTSRPNTRRRHVRIQAAIVTTPMILSQSIAGPEHARLPTGDMAAAGEQPNGVAVAAQDQFQARGGISASRR
jgi:hypothetical protein